MVRRSAGGCAAQGQRCRGGDPSGIRAFSHGSPCGDYVGWIRIIGVHALISGV